MYNGHKHVTPINSLCFFFLSIFSASATILKFRYTERDTKIWINLPLRFDATE